MVILTLRYVECEDI